MIHNPNNSIKPNTFPAVAENYRLIQEDIIATALRYNRDPAEITLIGVSKGYTWGHTQSAYAAGCRDFGESRIQEALPKIEEAPGDIEWHMIGSLQKNKVKKAIGRFVLIHSVDNLDLAQKISECSEDVGLVTPILLEVNTSGEMTKHGLDEENWRHSFDLLLKLPGIKLEGLMTMAPFIDDEITVRRCFARLRQFRNELALRGSGRHLSMGMTHDYRWAIAEGATYLRIGRGIFK